MQLSKYEFELVNKHNAQFVSFKYMGDNGLLKQIDISTHAVRRGDLFVPHDLKLKTIETKAFLDPFRSAPTMSFYCENHASKVNLRQIAEKICNSSKGSSLNEYFAEISFWATNDDAQNSNSRLSSIYSADPVDQSANLRAEIIATLEAVGIKTTAHYHGNTSCEGVIGIMGKTIVDLADNVIIAKFIIANVSASYSLHASFACKNNVNLRLFVKTENDKDYTSLLARSKQALAKIDKNSFELREIHNYSADNKMILCVELVTSGQFVPYLCLVYLLSYEADSQLIQNELLPFFGKGSEKLSNSRDK